MKDFTIGKRYGLIPYEQTGFKYVPKDKWDEIRRVGVFVLEIENDRVKVKPASYQYIEWYYISPEHICEWEEPINDLGARVVKMLREKPALDVIKDGVTARSYYTDNIVRYGIADVKSAYDYYKRFAGFYDITDVKFNGPATIVFWKDGSKTIVKAQNGEPNDPEKAIAMCIAKHFLGSNKTGSNYYDQIKKWLPKEEKKPELIGKVEEVKMTEEGILAKAKLKEKKIKMEELKNV